VDEGYRRAGQKRRVAGADYGAGNRSTVEQAVAAGAPQTAASEALAKEHRDALAKFAREGRGPQQDLDERLSAYKQAQSDLGGAEPMSRGCGACRDSTR